MLVGQFHHFLKGGSNEDIIFERVVGFVRRQSVWLYSLHYR